MIGGDDNQGVPRVLAIKIVGETDSSVEFPVVVNHRSDIRDMRRGVDIFRFDKREKAARVLIVQQSYGRPGHVVNRRLAVFVPVQLETHILRREKTKKFAGTWPL